MPGINEFIQTMIGMRDLQLRREVAQNNKRAQEAQTTLAGVAQFLQLAQASPDPISQSVLSQVFADRGVAPKGVLDAMLAGIVPSETTIRAGAAQEGIKAEKSGTPTNARQREAASVVSTGMNTGNMQASQFLTQVVKDATPLGDAYRSRLAAGMGQGDVALQASLAGLPAEQQAQRAMIAAGTSMSAPQDASNQLGWANLRQGERQLMSTSALQELELGIRSRASAGGAGGGNFNPDELLATKQRLLNQIQANRQSLNAAVLQSYIGSINAINQQLSNAGIANEGQIPYDPKILVSPGMFESFLNRFKGGPTGGNLQPMPATNRVLVNPILQPPPGGTR